MKKLVSICLCILPVALLVLPTTEGVAQTVRVKREAISPRLRTGPTNTWQISSGLRVVGKGMKVFLSADTTGSVTSFAWSFNGRPAGSTTTFDSLTTKATSFVADTGGFYFVQVVANGSLTAYDTIFASTYQGYGDNFGQCSGPCHTVNKGAWNSTAHATIYQRGITGRLEEEMGFGVYAATCIKCHTTGWEPNVSNGNFGYLAKQTGWDTTWYKPYLFWNNEYLIPYGDTTSLHNMLTNYASVVPTANIGCEACHGPGKDHNGDKKKIGMSVDAGVCNQCHDAPNKHRIGTYWAASKHGSFPEGSHTGRISCFPCHSGSAFVKWLNNKSNPGYDTTTIGGLPSPTSDANRNVSCTACHDPHGNSNPHQLRAMSIDSLKNGYVPPAGIGGNGLICANCHSARYSVKARVTNNPPYYGFADRYGPHENPQADMYFGSNGYQYGDNSLTGQMTHAGLEDGCVTCHMATRVIGSSVHSNHELNMQDTTGGLHDVVTACRPCHGSYIMHFDEILAFSDYDQDGTIEGVQSEVAGLLARLKAWLPIDSTTGEPVNMMRDSLKVKNHPEYVRGIWTYYFVRNDASLGIHNTKYAVALLQKALGIYPLDVQPVDNTVPDAFALNQNYPNPFNPTTTISFALPEKAGVTLVVYDMLGRLVTTLVDDEMEAGTYKVGWNGADRNGERVSSGVYLYKLQAGSFSMTRKMLIVK